MILLFKSPQYLYLIILITTFNTTPPPTIHPSPIYYPIINNNNKAAPFYYIYTKLNQVYRFFNNNFEKELVIVRREACGRVTDGFL